MLQTIAKLVALAALLGVVSGSLKDGWEREYGDDLTQPLLFVDSVILTITAVLLTINPNYRTQWGDLNPVLILGPIGVGIITGWHIGTTVYPTVRKQFWL